MQGRSLRNGAITQEITDTSKTYKLLGSEKYALRGVSHHKSYNSDFFCRAVCLESSQVRTVNDGGAAATDEYHDLYTLAGHEASY